MKLGESCWGFIFILAISVCLLNCSGSKPPKTFEYLTYRAYDESGMEVLNAGFLPESVFMQFTLGNRPPRWFKARSGRCAELLSHVSKDYVRLAYSAYRNGENSQPLATIELQCMLFRGYDETCLQRLEDAVQKAISKVKAENPKNNGRAQMISVLLIEQKKHEDCALKELSSPSRRFSMIDNQH